MPEQGGEEEAGRHRLALTDATIGAGERQADETFSGRLVENDVEQREQAAMQTLFAQLRDAADGVTTGEQLDDLVEQA